MAQSPSLDQQIRVDLGPRSYDIFVGSDTLAQLGGACRDACQARRVVVISDTTVADLYAEPALASLRGAGLDAQLLTVNPGEASKTLAVVASLYDRLFELAVERSDAVLALGGGVVGDLAGFVAATFKRGLDFIQAPTTLLAMVDSSIGAKLNDRPASPCPPILVRSDWISSTIGK